MSTHENSYRSEIKSLAGECYEWGRVDAFTQVWEKLEMMRRHINDKGQHATSGYLLAIEQIEKIVDSGFEGANSEHDRQVARRMKNVDIAIDSLMAAAIKGGYLVPQRVTV